MKCGAAILAAGISSRMGRAKPLLPWGETTIIGHLVALYLRRVDQVAVVCRPEDAPLHHELDRLALCPHNRIHNPDAGSDMYGSVRLALGWPGWDPGITHLLLALSDQPQIRATTVSALQELARTNPGKIIQPWREGRRRHPVIVPVATARGIVRDPAFTSLREALDAHREAIQTLAVDDPGTEIDLDSPADYDEAVERFAPGPSKASRTHIQSGRKAEGNVRRDPPDRRRN